ncbi:MAG: hypothetical protein WA421_08720 [Nitrososphaeraceae archaeon]
MITKEMILPVANLRAKELDRDLLPHREVVKAYSDVGQVYERSCHDRSYEWFYSQINGKESMRSQPIDQRIINLCRLKDSKGEWLTYGVELYGRNWEYNQVDFYHHEGIIEGMPQFHNKINPQTEEIDSNATTVHSLKTVYTIPFSKQKVDEISKYFSDSVQFIIKERGSGRKYACNQQEFRDLPYDELISIKNGYSEYIRNRKAQQ